jgi:peroxiredoxin
MRLANALEPKGVRVLWVSRDPIEVTKEYCLKRGILLSDVLADPPYRTYTQLGLARVPNTVLVDATGTVEKVWPGRLGHALCLFWSAARENFCGPKCGWGHSNKLRK